MDVFNTGITANPERQSIRFMNNGSMPPLWKKKRESEEAVFRVDTNWECDFKREMIEFVKGLDVQKR